MALFTNRLRLFTALPLAAWPVIFVCISLCFAVSDTGLSVEKAEDGGRVVKCPYCGRYMKVGKVRGDAVETVERQVKAGLLGRDMASADGAKERESINVLIFRWEERQGGELSVEKPASVGFHMHLMVGSTLRKVYVFDEYQQSLSENVLSAGKFFRRGMIWVTADDLSREGVENGLSRLLGEGR
jgi:hypothetical protein